MEKIKTSVFQRGIGKRSKNGMRRKAAGADGRRRDAWIARIRYTDPDTGKLKTLERQSDPDTGKPFESKDAARDFIRDKVREIEERAKVGTVSGLKAGEKMTVAELIDECNAEIFIEPKINAEGRKIEGHRAWYKARSFLKQVNAYLGPKRLREIREKDLRRYRTHREMPEGEEAKPVATITVDRELSYFSVCWSHALERGYITHNPFANRKKVILRPDVRRSRILSRDEEARLMKVCAEEYAVPYTRKFRDHETESVMTKKLNKELRALIALAVSTGCRKGELLKMRWQDLDWNGDRVSVVGTHTKTERARQTLFTDAAQTELRKIMTGDERPDGLIFKTGDFKRAFTKALELAEIEDFHFHDLRRTAISRWQAAGIPLGMAQAFAGHHNSEMTQSVYTAASSEMISDYTAMLNRYNVAQVTPATVEVARAYAN